MGWMRWVRVVVVLLVLGSMGGAATLVASPPAGAADPPVGSSTLFPTGAPYGAQIVTGADGALWFNVPAGDSASWIGRRGTDGVVTKFVDPAIQNAAALAVGPDAAVWFTDPKSNIVGRITTAGVVSAFPAPDFTVGHAITKGPDGAMWVPGVDTHGPVLARVSTAGVIQPYRLPAGPTPWAITTGPDGSLWFVGPGLVGRMSTDGVPTYYPAAASSYALSIIAGPDGAMWFTDPLQGTITRISTSGSFERFRRPGINGPSGIVAGPDGALWVTDASGGSIGRMTTDGVAASFTTGADHTNGVTIGADDALWFTGSTGSTGSIGRLQVLGPPSPPQSLVAVAGASSATVSWGQGADGGSPVTGYEITASPGGATCMWTSGARTCTVTGLSPGVAYTFTGRATSAKGPGPASGPSVPVVVRAGAAFHPTTPTRVLDTRTTVGGSPGPLVSETGRSLSLDTAVVPESATAVIMNVTVTEPSTSSYLTVWPGGEPKPVTSNLNFGAGETIANLVTVKLGTLHTIELATAWGATHVAADLVGWFDDGTGAGSLFNPTGPTRVLDSRTATGTWTGKLVAGAPRDLTLTGVPADATAVVANITATGSTTGSFLTAWPAGIPQPNASSVNFGPGQTIPNLAVIPIGADHKISLATAVGSTDVVVDVTGWFSPTGGSRFHVMSPQRILDDRLAVGLDGPWATAARTLTVNPPLPADASALVVNVTATNSTANSFVRVFPSGQAAPVASSLNFGTGQTIPNLVMIAIGTGHGIDLRNTFGSVDLVADAVGYYAAT